MLPKFEAKQIYERLDEMPRWKVLAFACLLLERAVPDFFRFQAETQAPGGGVLRAALSRAWCVLETGDSSYCVAISASVCDLIAPDTECYSSRYTSAALDATAIASNLLRYIDGGPTSLIVEAASLRRDSIDMQLQFSLQLDVTREDFERLILEHPAMQRELQHQDADLIFLNGLGESREATWQEIVSRSVEGD